jgi:nitrogen fixation protein NifX
MTMHLLRQLRVARGAEASNSAGRISVGFASSDGQTVDQHFGVTSSVVVYSVGKVTAQVERIGEFATNADDAGARLSEKLAWLTGTNVLYATAIGSSASAQLMARGVLPLRASAGSPIQGLVEVLQSELEEGVAEWLAQVTRLKWKMVRREGRLADLLVQEEQ